MTVSSEAFEKLLDKAVKLQEELTSERDRADALSAHVKRMAKASEELENVVIEGNPYGDYDGLCALLRHCRESRDRMPDTSLAQRDARVAAEALRKEAEGFDRDALDGDDDFEIHTYRRVARTLRASADKIAAGGGDE